MHPKDYLTKAFLNFSMNDIKNMHEMRCKQQDSSEVTLSIFMQQFVEINKRFFFKKSIQQYFEGALESAS